MKLSLARYADRVFAKGRVLSELKAPGVEDDLAGTSLTDQCEQPSAAVALDAGFITTPTTLTPTAGCRRGPTTSAGSSVPFGKHSIT